MINVSLSLNTIRSIFSVSDFVIVPNAHQNKVRENDRTHM